MPGWDGSGFLAAVARGRAVVHAAAEQRVHDAGTTLLQHAQGAGDFPYDTGSLQSSGAVADPVWAGDVVDVDVTFGGPSGGPNDPVVYAEYVHDGFDLVAWGHATGRHIAGRPYLGQPLDAEGVQLVDQAATDTFADVQAAWGGS